MTTAEFGKVAVLFGGWSSERDVSLQSGACVREALLEAGVDAHAIDPKPADLLTLRSAGFARVFNVLHGTPGEDGLLQAACALQGLPVTGSGLQASANALDKAATKALWRQAGIPVADDVVLTHAEAAEADLDAVVAELGLPVFVKPPLEGSSVGVSKAETVEALRTAIEAASAFGTRVMIEAEVAGREMTAGFVGDDNLPLIEIVSPARFYDYDAKYLSDATQYIVPCGLPGELEQALQAQARAAYDAVGCSGWGRVDFMLTDDGRAVFLEVNTVPGMTTHSLVPKAAAALGWNLPTLVKRILAQTLQRDAEVAA